MKRLSMLRMSLIAVICFCTAPLFAKHKQKIAIYTEEPGYQKLYIPSGWMGSFKDLSLDLNSPSNPHAGHVCMKITYRHDPDAKDQWAGIYWQNPSQNWGARDAGLDLGKRKKLTFWARGENGGEVIESIGIGGITGKFSDSDKIEIGPITLTKDWKQYEINLVTVDLSYIIGGMFWATSQIANSGEPGIVWYIDDLVFD